MGLTPTAKLPLPKKVVSIYGLTRRDYKGTLFPYSQVNIEYYLFLKYLFIYFGCTVSLLRHVGS